MTIPYDPDDKLERLIGSLLREQPLRTAPRTLELRILREIARRTALPSSPMNFMRWPIAGRVAFLVLCLATVKFSLSATTWGAEHVQAVTRFIPMDWAIGLLIFAAAMYAALFALGAVAYRTLSTQR